MEHFLYLFVKATSIHFWYIAVRYGLNSMGIKMVDTTMGPIHNGTKYVSAVFFLEHVYTLRMWITDKVLKGWDRIKMMNVRCPLSNASSLFNCGKEYAQRSVGHLSILY